MDHTELLHFLGGVPLFSTATPALLLSLLHQQGLHTLRAAAGEPIEERYASMLGVVLEGELQILSADPDTNVVLRTLCKAQVFGAASLFSNEEASLSRLVAATDVTLLFFERETIRRLLAADPAFLDAYLAFLAGRVRFLNAKIRCFTAGSADRRLALWLAEQPEGTPFPVSSLTTLADTLNIGRASLYRALDKLEAEGLITRNGREITVPHTETLLQKYHS